jgi:hypothetical protein
MKQREKIINTKFNEHKTLSSFIWKVRREKMRGYG